MRHTCFLATLGLVLAAAQPAFAQNGTNPPAVIDIRDPLIAPAPDNQSRRITDAAQAFLATLSDRQRAAVLFPLTDDAQRSNWSNLPDGIVTRLVARFKRSGWQSTESWTSSSADSKQRFDGRDPEGGSQ